MRVNRVECLGEGCSFIPRQRPQGPQPQAISAPQRCMTRGPIPANGSNTATRTAEGESPHLSVGFPRIIPTSPLQLPITVAIWITPKALRRGWKTTGGPNSKRQRLAIQRTPAPKPRQPIEMRSKRSSTWC